MRSTTLPASANPNDVYVSSIRALHDAVSYTHLDVYKRQVQSRLKMTTKPA